MKQTLEQMKANTEIAGKDKLSKEQVLSILKELTNDFEEIGISTDRYDVTDQSQCSV